MNEAVCSLEQKSCKPCEGGVPPLSAADVERLLAQLKGWARDGEAIVKVFAFKNYYETIAFVNACAWVSHRENHHPELLVGFKECRVRYVTHAIGGLSENDFICAAKIDTLTGNPPH